MMKTNTNKQPINEHPLVFFDNRCHLCSGSVEFIMKHDSKGKIRFIPLQTKKAGEILEQYNINLKNQGLASVYLMENGKLYDHSSAALKIFRHLDGAWPGLYIFILVPKFIRDGVYNFIANNRYKWFGKKKYGYTPPKSFTNRFIK